VSQPRRPARQGARQWQTGPATGGSVLALPVVITQPASEIGETYVTLNASIIPEGTRTSAWFAWGYTPQYTNTTTAMNVGIGDLPTPFADTLTGLQPGITYHFAAVAGSAAGTVYGQDMIVTLLAGAPAVKLPQFDAPFRFGSDGRPVVVEQDSPQEVGAAVYNVLICEQGAKLNDPGFGRRAPLFDNVPLDLTGTLAALRRLEPRASYTLTELAALIDPSQQYIAVTAETASQPGS
jgi:hypothetical protein